MPMLELKGLTKQFGGLLAVSNFDMAVNKGEIVGLIGPNGAGKSTIFNMITGVYPPTRGQVFFEDKDITKKKPHEVAALGVGRGLMANPRLLCMDEPSLGLAPIVVEQLGVVIRDINKKGVSVLLVEQNVNLALGVASRGYALQVGRVVLQGDINTMKNSDIVKKAYLGG